MKQRTIMKIFLLILPIAWSCSSEFSADNGQPAAKSSSKELEGSGSDKNSPIAAEVERYNNQELVVEQQESLNIDEDDSVQAPQQIGGAFLVDCQLAQDTGIGGCKLLEHKKKSDRDIKFTKLALITELDEVTILKPLPPGNTDFHMIFTLSPELIDDYHHAILESEFIMDGKIYRTSMRAQPANEDLESTAPKTSEDSEVQNPKASEDWNTPTESASNHGASDATTPNSNFIENSANTIRMLSEAFANTANGFATVVRAFKEPKSRKGPSH